MSKTEILLDLFITVVKCKGESFYDDLNARLIDLERSLETECKKEFDRYKRLSSIKLNEFNNSKEAPT